ncbi:hypothetical protein [Janthinobacterium psychrotolerans]|uniref:Uncharacterized protein n=1 Tax=Janthinobacterium psychrotolerans TaxID=1747903 RepID=A0A1A7C5V9_9BURK|nr:hypothetical protein [Janthinobacterium psychrotolerans]OBV41092.1 hypothetical protein ASR47_102412 [Janthinobacterium psychrotolerans]
MTPPATPITATLAALASLVEALEAIESSHFGPQLAQAGTAHAYHDIALELAYASNSRWLRDTGDERVHRILNDIQPLLASINAFFRIKLWPTSTAQNQRWTHALSRDPAARYAVRDDGSLEISLLDASLHGELLSVRRLWSHVSNYSGSITAFELKLDADQLAECRQRLASLRSFPLPV